MELNDLRALVTAFSFTAFIGIVVWAYARSNRDRFDEAARTPFLDEPGRAGADKRAAHRPGDLS